MNIKSTFFATILVLGSACASLAQDIPVTNFGATAFTDDSWTFNSGTNSLSGQEGLGFLMYGEPLSNNFIGITQLSITANVLDAANAPLNGFTFLLQDAQDDTVTGVFNWVDFIGGRTVTVQLSNISPTFDYNNVIGWNLVGGGSNANVSVILTSVVASAVPEPSTYAAFAGLVVLGAVASRRRRAA